MFTETLTVNLGGSSQRSDEKLKSSALDTAKKRCNDLSRTTIYSDAHVLNINEGIVLVRYICD